jgi:hypothetical protein
MMWIEPGEGIRKGKFDIIGWCKGEKEVPQLFLTYIVAKPLGVAKREYSSSSLARNCRLLSR